MSARVCTREPIRQTQVNPTAATKICSTQGGGVCLRLTCVLLSHRRSMTPNKREALCLRALPLGSVFQMAPPLVAATTGHKKTHNNVISLCMATE